MFNRLLFIMILSVGMGSFAQSTPDPKGSTERLVEILRPYVAELDRNLWTFRYEHADTFSPSEVIDLKMRLSSWAHRFYDPLIIQGADTGPGVYVATDPAATATWGREDPRMFAIQIKKGTRVLIGDQFSIPRESGEKLKRISTELRCGSLSTQMRYDLGHVIGFFRMNENIHCREVVISALKTLGVQVVSYSFNSIPFKSCRVTGTALSIIDFSAVAADQLNWYSPEYRIEGQSDITPFVYALFNEAKNDYYSQSILANGDVWEKYMQGFGFFTGVSPAPQTTAYLNWKKQNILKCGPKWSIELPHPFGQKHSLIRLNPDPEIQQLLLKMHWAYIEKTKMILPPRPEEFRPYRIRAVMDRFRLDNETLLRLHLAQAPKGSKRTRSTYLEILNYCWQVYRSESVEKIISGECGIVPVE